jgi:CMP-N-acetylneuraminic acid synthetase
MYKGKRFLAIIPARSGSKGVRDKNIRPLCGKPLMAYTIEAAIDCGVIDMVLVSTDSEEYASIAKKYGAEVPFLRPLNISGDMSLASEYIVHALESLREAGHTYDYFVLLQPTSPLRKTEHIIAGVQMIVGENLDSVVSFSEAEHPPAYFHSLPNDFNLGSLALTESNRQEHKKQYRINGMLYIAKCDNYLQNHSFYGENSKALIIDNSYALDIDSEHDFALAEFLWERMQSGYEIQ